MQKQLYLGFIRFLLVPLVVSIAYSNSLYGDFQFDDVRAIVEDFRVRDIYIFSKVDWVNEILSGTRPLTALSFALNYAAGEFDTSGYHILNLLIHLSVVALIYLFTVKVLHSSGYEEPEKLALIISAIFGLAPVNVQAVSYIAQRAEILSSFFYIASLLFFIKTLDYGFCSRWLFFYISGFLALFLGLGAKDIIVTLPVAYLLYYKTFFSDTRMYRRSSGSTWSRLAVPLPFIVLGGVYVFLRLKSLAGNASAGFALEGLSPTVYLITQFKVLLTYLRLIVFPFNLNLDYDYPVSAGFFEVETFVSFLLLLALFIFATGSFYASCKKTRVRGEGKSPLIVISYGIFWYFLVLMPTSSFVPIIDVINEHRVYLASWGVITAIVISIEAIFSFLRYENKTKLVLSIILLIVLLSFSLLVYKRNKVWASNVSLWSDVVKKSSSKARAYLNLGHGLIMEKGCLAAWPILNQGLRLVERGSTVKVDILNNLAICSMEFGQNSQALVYAMRAAVIAPEAGDVQNTLGEIYLATRDYVKASGYFLDAIAIRPSASRCYNAALAFEGSGDQGLACVYWKKYIDLETDEASIREVLEYMKEKGCS